ncbi:hypothetical protein CX676_18980 [Paracoccus zhejiangensis]|uniref:Uncharacterized protein n=1 Tax=Paracoccus zhejiangensis TaxID=1077935 RepID=A0A2H5F358_9RHOB|nr:hypothetical protein CX676_18980 [Paracoccus zhejiangensis]
MVGTSVEWPRNIPMAAVAPKTGGIDLIFLGVAQGIHAHAAVAGNYMRDGDGFDHRLAIARERFPRRP